MKSIFRVLGTWMLLIVPFSSSAISFTQVIGFGDSLSDTGNLFSLTGGTVPDPAHYYNGRFQNGPSYIEGLAGSFSLSAGPVELGGTNYAVGGARSRYHALDVDANGGVPPIGISPPKPFSLLGQLDRFFTDLGGASADPDALYVVWAGANDIQDVLTLAFLGGNATGRLTEAVADVGSVITGLVGAGADTLLVPLLPDIGAVPGVRALGPTAQAAARSYSEAFNDALDSALAGLSANIIRYDTLSLVDEILADPAAYGLLNTNDPCLTGFYVSEPIGGPISQCSNPDDYLFWDIVHPSARFQQILAGKLRNAVPEPAILVLMSLGLVGIGYSRRSRWEAMVMGVRDFGTL